MALPGLPLEIWLEIIALIPEGYVRKLMGVNRMLFDLAQSWLYREVRVGARDDEALWRLQQLGKADPDNDDIAQRVKRLAVFVNCSPEGGRGKMSLGRRLMMYRPRVSALAGVLHRLCKWRRERDPLTKLETSVLKLAKETVPRLRNVDEVMIRLHQHEGAAVPPVALGTFLEAMWPSFAPRLQKIELKVTMEGLQEVLAPLLLFQNHGRGHQHRGPGRPERVRLPCLRVLEVELTLCSNTSPTKNEEILEQVLGEFVEEYGETIEELKLTVRRDSYSEYSQPGPVLKFESLPLVGTGRVKFPRLRVLDVSLGKELPTANDQTSFASFLWDHKQTLERLTLRNPKGYYEMEPGICAFGFRRLEDEEVHERFFQNLEFKDVPWMFVKRNLPVSSLAI